MYDQYNERHARKQMYFGECTYLLTYILLVSLQYKHNTRRVQKKLAYATEGEVFLEFYVLQTLNRVILCAIVYKSLFQ